MKQPELETIFAKLLLALDPSPEREGVRETPSRMANAWTSYTQGYHQDPEAILKTFEDGAEHYDEMVVVGGISFYSMCEHHGAPIFGQATIGYIPAKRVVGLSKLVRLTDVFARRFQVQERLTQQIAHTMNDVLSPLGVGVMIRARHLCMEARGVQRMGTITTTTTLLGELREGSPRAEFLQRAAAHNGPL